jgi:hypothetical protein
MTTGPNARLTDHGEIGTRQISAAKPGWATFIVVVRRYRSRKEEVIRTNRNRDRPCSYQNTFRRSDWDLPNRKDALRAEPSVLIRTPCPSVSKTMESFNATAEHLVKVPAQHAMNLHSEIENIFPIWSRRKASCSSVTTPALNLMVKPLTSFVMLPA